MSPWRRDAHHGAEPARRARLVLVHDDVERADVEHDDVEPSGTDDGLHGVAGDSVRGTARRPAWSAPVDRPGCAAAMRVLLAGDRATSPEEDRALRRHLVQCPDCAGLAGDADAHAAQRVLDRLAPSRPRRSRRMQWALGIVASVQLALALPWTFGVNVLAFLGGDVSTQHLTRDGALGVIIASAGLLAAVRPRHSYATLVIAVAAVVLHSFGFAVDDARNLVHPLFELTHVLVAVILAMIGSFVFGGSAPEGSRGLVEPS